MKFLRVIRFDGSDDHVGQPLDRSGVDRAPEEEPQQERPTDHRSSEVEVRLRIDLSPSDRSLEHPDEGSHPIDYEGIDQLDETRLPLRANVDASSFDDVQWEDNRGYHAHVTALDSAGG